MTYCLVTFDEKAVILYGHMSIFSAVDVPARQPEGRLEFVSGRSYVSTRSVDRFDVDTMPFP